MELEKIIDNIDRASVEAFGINVPKDKIIYHIQDISNHLINLKKSLLSFHFESNISMPTTSEDLVKSYDELEEIYKDSLGVGGFHSLRLMKDGSIGSDITILMPNEYNQDLSEDYFFLTKVAHEIGHAIMEQEKDLNWNSKRIRKKFAKRFGIMN